MIKDGTSGALQDRRIKARHKAPCLQISIRQQGLLAWLKPAIQVVCIDINRYGMAIETDTTLNLRDKLRLDFKGKYISQSNVDAVVSSIRPLGSGGYRVGLTFTYSVCQKHYSREMDNALSRIEHLYHQRNNELR